MVGLLQDAQSAFNEVNDLSTNTSRHIQIQMDENTVYYRDMFERISLLVHIEAPKGTAVALDMLGELANDIECLSEFQRVVKDCEEAIRDPLCYQCRVFVAPGDRDDFLNVLGKVFGRTLDSDEEALILLVYRKRLGMLLVNFAAETKELPQDVGIQDTNTQIAEHLILD